MNDMTDNLPNFMTSGPLAHALIGLLILVVGLFLVKLLSALLKKGLDRIEFLHPRNEDGTTTDFVNPTVGLIKALLTIFVLMAVLQHFGLTDVLEPLKSMLSKFTNAIPNIIGAGVVAYAGWIIASIAAKLTRLALGKVDEQLALRTRVDELKISRFGGAFVFAAILLPIAVAALGVLNIPAITVPATEMITDLMRAIPRIIGAAIILLVTYFAARFVVYILGGILEGLHINDWPEKIGLHGIFTPTFTPVRLVSGAIIFFAMLTAATAAVETLGIELISVIFARILEFGGGILVGALILIIGNWLGGLAYRKLEQHGSPGMASIARIAILGLVLAMGLKSMGLADNIVNMAFGFTIGGVAVAVALAFGFGGRDAAKSIADRWAARLHGDDAPTPRSRARQTKADPAK